MPLKIRTIYFKVSDMKAAADFWQKLLDVTPHKNADNWHEFMVGGTRLGLLLNNFDDKFTGSNCVPVFEFSDTELSQWVEKAKAVGAIIVVDGLADPKMKSIVFKDPWDNEFEFTRFHD